jgi:hypothetical protein
MYEIASLITFARKDTAQSGRPEYGKTFTIDLIQEQVFDLSNG